MKIIKYTLLAVLLLIVASLVAGWLYLEPLVRGIVNKYGTQVVGTEVNLQGFKFHPLDGEVEIKGLTVANPEGYSSPNLLSLGGLFVKIKPSSLLSDKIIVENVTINKPEIIYEMPNFSTSNVMQIQQNIAQNSKSSDSVKDVKVEENAEVKEDKPAKSVIIKKVLVEGGAISAITPLQNKDTTLTLNMPAIELTGIGEEKENMSICDSIATIFNKILFNATSVVTKALGSAKDMAKKAASSAVDTAKNAADAVATETGGLLNSLKFW